MLTMNVNSVFLFLKETFCSYVAKVKSTIRREPDEFSQLRQLFQVI